MLRASFLAVHTHVLHRHTLWSCLCLPQSLRLSCQIAHKKTYVLPAMSIDLVDGRHKEYVESAAEEHLAILESCSYAVGRPLRHLPIRPVGCQKKSNTVSPAQPQQPSQQNQGSTMVNARSRSISITESDKLRLHEIASITSNTPSTTSTNTLRRKLLEILGSSSSVAKLWEAYSVLLDLPLPPNYPSGKPRVPLVLLHRLSRVLSRNRPKTRSQFLRHLSVLQQLHKSGGHIHLHEWNALIHNAGQGWRKTRPADFQLALDVYQDMVNRRVPGSTTADNDLGMGPLHGEPPQPNIITYTTLIGIAAGTLHAPTIHRATALLQSSGFPPNRITHLAMLRYFTFTRQLYGVRSTLLKMKQQGLELGLDGINACIWAYAYNSDIDLVKNIYRVLRHNLRPEAESAEVEAIIRQLSDKECIDIDPRMVPNAVTYTVAIQALSYRGDLEASLHVFMEMLAAHKLEAGVPLDHEDSGVPASSHYTPTLPVYRALFLGFARHGIHSTEKYQDPSKPMPIIASDMKQWNRDNLISLFELFMSLPDIKPSRSVIFWIMTAFIKTSGDDRDLLCNIWARMEERFDGPWGGPDNRLQRLKAELFRNEDD